MTGRGTGWVVAQFTLMAAILVAGLVPPHWPREGHFATSAVGAVLVVAGAGLAVWASRSLGRSFTPFPKPLGAGLVTEGPFAIVRHPVYTGGIAFFLGYSLCASVPAVVLTVALAALWVGKLGVEEGLLSNAYDAYPGYRRRVRWRLLPFVY